MEVPGESGVVTGEYGAHVVYAMQYGTNTTPGKYQRTLSQPKHFLVYNLEGRKGDPSPPYPPRPSFNAIVSERDLTGFYLLPWASTVQRGRASGVMCSVNQVNGIPSCASPYLKSLLYESYNMTGAIITDGGAW